MHMFVLVCRNFGHLCGDVTAYVVYIRILTTALILGYVAFASVIKYNNVQALRDYK